MKICTICGSRPALKKESRCRQCKKYAWKRYKKSVCELCGFVPVNGCQLDVDHIDGDNANNKESNLMTLCANCHRLKTFLNGDHLS